MSKIRVIDLLNKIANGEEVPKKIKYKGWLFAFDRQPQDYYCEEYGNLFEYLINEKRTSEFVNDEVEIIDNEEWKLINDFPNYEISTNGNIRTKEYCDDKGHIRKSKLLSKQINNCGYEYVILSNEFIKHKTLTVHRLMAKTFLNDYSEELQVNHIDGIKTNNNIKNLEMCSASENVKKRYEIGNDGNNYKAVEQYDLDGNYIATYKSSYEAEKMTGIGRTCIGGCCRKEHHTAGGYIWKFKDELEEEKKIPEELKIGQDTPSSNYYIRNENGTKCILTKHSKMIIETLNQLIDYLKSKGE